MLSHWSSPPKYGYLPPAVLLSLIVPGNGSTRLSWIRCLLLDDYIVTVLLELSQGRSFELHLPRGNSVPFRTTNPHGLLIAITANA